MVIREIQKNTGYVYKYKHIKNYNFFIYQIVKQCFSIMVYDFEPLY
jgi:hypothetical protein